jgi:cell division septum initiation protein DivIVA
VDGVLPARPLRARGEAAEGVYRVFEALDQLVTIVEEARGLPMTASCVVPRGDVLDLLDDIRDAVPGEMDDAQDVLDHRDQMLEEARVSAEKTVSGARDEAGHLIASARAEATKTVAAAQAEADHTVDDATGRAETLLARAQSDADRTIQAGQDQHDALVSRGHGEAERLVAAGRATYERAVSDGHAEQARLVSQSEVVQAAHIEAARIVDNTHAEADRMRAECDRYVDGWLAELEETLTKTLRTIARGRTALRAGVPADYHD